MNTLVEMLSPDFLLKEALYGSVLISIVCPLAGVYLVLRRMVLFGIALPHISSAGIAFAYLLHATGIYLVPHEDLERTMAMLGSLTFTCIAVVIMVFVIHRGFTLTDAQIGAVYAAAAAASILFVAANPFGEQEILALLKGEVLGILPEDLIPLAGTAICLFVAFAVFQRTFILVSFDRDMAITLGKPVVAWDLFLFGLIGILVAHGVMLVGPLMVFGFLILPALAAHQIAMHFAWGMPQLSVLAATFGGMSSLTGFSLSMRFDLPLSPTNVAMAFVVLLVTTLTTTILRMTRAHE